MYSLFSICLSLFSQSNEAETSDEVCLIEMAGNPALEEADFAWIKVNFNVNSFIFLTSLLGISA